MAATAVSEAATAPDDLASQMAWRGVRAKLLAARDDLQKAEALATEAVSYADRTDLFMAADAHADLAVVLEASGDAERGAEEYRAALALYEHMGDVVSAERMRRESDRLRITLARRG